MNCNYKEKIKGSINRDKIKSKKIQTDRFRKISGLTSGAETPANYNE